MTVGHRIQGGSPGPVWLKYVVVYKFGLGLGPLALKRASKTVGSWIKDVDLRVGREGF